MNTDYLKRILTSKVYDVAVETSLDLAPQLSARIGNTVLLKREDMQSVFSFKLRGAYNKMAHLSPEQLAQGVIASSAGNHAQGVAYHAQRLGLPVRAALLAAQQRLHAQWPQAHLVLVLGLEKITRYMH